MFFTKATASGTAGSAPASDAGGNGGAVPSSSSAAARSGEIRARHGASYATAAVIPSSYSNQNDGEDGDGGRRAGGGSSSASSSLGNDPDNAAPGAHSRLLFSRLAAAASPLLGTGSGALLTALVCLCWMGVSSLLILLNKHLLATGFHYPMALSCLGMLFSSVAAFFCCRVTNLVEARRNAFSPREYLTKVVPGAFLYFVFKRGGGGRGDRRRERGRRRKRKKKKTHALFSPSKNSKKKKLSGSPHGPHLTFWKRRLPLPDGLLHSDAEGVHPGRHYG